MGNDQRPPHANLLGDVLRRASLSDLNDINALLNHPNVRPHIGRGSHAIDAGPVLEDERNIVLFDERGGAMFIWRGPGVYEGHSFFLRDALRAGREALSQVKADLIWGLTPSGNKAARWFNRQLGFKSLGETPRGELFEMRF